MKEEAIMKAYEEEQLLKIKVFMLTECLKASKASGSAFVKKVENKLSELLELDCQGDSK